MHMVKILIVLLILARSADAFTGPAFTKSLRPIMRNIRNACIRSTRASTNILSDVRMDDEMARKGIKVDMTVHRY